MAGPNICVVGNACILGDRPRICESRGNTPWPCSLWSCT
jgi:hypothetical protein